MSDCIAVLNAGSSSIKFALYHEGALLFRGQIEGIGLAAHLKVQDSHGETVADRGWPAGELDHRAATQEILQTGAELLRGTARVIAVGHRVVHGGMEYAEPVRINDGVLTTLSRLVPLAPLHQPHNLAPIYTIAEQAPQIPQVACFDTAFHRGQADVVQSFALPRRFTEEGVRRYGFHGLSYEYIVSRLQEIAPKVAASRLIIAHLGNGASLCAVHDGRSVASTMGFTAVDGLMMGTRCGAIDPGVIIYLMDRYGMDVRAIEDLIYRKSGCWACPAPHRTCACCGPLRIRRQPRRSRSSSTVSSARLVRLPLPSGVSMRSYSPQGLARTTPQPAPRWRWAAPGSG
jgi:acetate kinase